MRKLFAAVVFLLFAIHLHAQNTATITGHLADPGSSAISSRTFVRAELQSSGGNQCRVNGVALVTPYFRDFQATAGALSFTIYKSSAITCGTTTGNSRWKFTIWRDGTPQAPCFLNITADTSLDSATCLNATDTPVIALPTALVYAKLDATNQPFTGGVTATTFNGTTGFQVAGGATSGTYLKGNGTNFVQSSGSASGTGSPTACTNQFVTGFTLNSDAAPTSTCTTDVLASAQHANQGTTTTVLHGNAAGNPSFAAVTPSDAAGNTSGSGSFCLTTSCVMTTPNIGAATGTSLNLSGNLTAFKFQSPSTTDFAASTSGALSLQTGFGSPNSVRLYWGDGSGWNLNLSKRVASVDTDIFTFKDSGVLSLNNAGSAGAPVLTINSATTGLFSPTAGQIGFSAGGTSIATINSTGPLGLYLGSTGTFAWGSAADPNGAGRDTGISRTAAGTIAIGNGTQGDASGQVQTAQLKLFTGSNTLPASIQNDTAGGISFQSNGGKTWVIQNGGNLVSPAGAIPVLQGVTSGFVALNVPAVAGSSQITIPAVTDQLTGRATTDTLTNKRITQRVVTLASSTTFTPDGDNSDITFMNMTGTAGTLTIAAPTGTPTDGQKLILRIKTTNSQTYSFNATYRFSSSVTAPASTGVGKTDYIGCIWNATDSKWDVLAVDLAH